MPSLQDRIALAEAQTRSLHPAQQISFKERLAVESGEIKLTRSQRREWNKRLEAQARQSPEATTRAVELRQQLRHMVWREVPEPLTGPVVSSLEGPEPHLPRRKGFVEALSIEAAQAELADLQRKVDRLKPYRGFDQSNEQARARFLSFGPE